jgi:hypothetical protein
MFYLSYLCLFVHSGVQHILCCVFALFFFVMLSVSLDCLFLIAPSVFSNVTTVVITNYYGNLNNWLNTLRIGHMG